MCLKRNSMRVLHEERKGGRNAHEETRLGRDGRLLVLKQKNKKFNTRSVTLTAGLWMLTKCNQIAWLTDICYNTVCWAVRARCISDEQRERWDFPQSYLQQPLQLTDQSRFFISVSISEACLKVKGVYLFYSEWRRLHLFIHPLCFPHFHNCLITPSHIPSFSTRLLSLAPIYYPL